ncbi:MAG: hypothetical protein ACI4R8_03725 [Candidatus Caccovivens sp.]
MTNSALSQKNVRIKCPACHNYMDAVALNDGSTKGQCGVCKCVIFSKQHTPKEQLIRIIKIK